jgi:hypothetical protein
MVGFNYASRWSSSFINNEQRALFNLERLPAGGLRLAGHHGAAAALVGGDVRLPQRRLELHLRAILQRGQEEVEQSTSLAYTMKEEPEHLTGRQC